MSYNIAQFPGQIYDGTTATRSDREEDKAPTYQDWDQCIAELIAAQEFLNDGRVFMAIADNGGPLIAGASVYMKSAGTIAYADADGSAAERVSIGLVTTGGADGTEFKVQCGAALDLTEAEWDAVAGTTGGLTKGAKYYLSDTPGRLSETPPVSIGDTLFVLGTAIKSTKLLVRLDDEGLVV